MPKDTSKNSESEAYMQYYVGSTTPVPASVQENIRNDPYLRASWKRHYAADQARKRAEDLQSWSLCLPRELMDIIIADPSLGVREHLALAAAAPELRRLYHNGDIWKQITESRTIPINGVQRTFSGRSTVVPPTPRMLGHLATAPQKKKANGPYFKPLHDPYSLHNVAIRDIRKHRISKEQITALYPNLTDEHVARLRFYPANTNGYPNMHTNAGYAEVAVEWLSIRVANGMA